MTFVYMVDSIVTQGYIQSQNFEPIEMKNVVKILITGFDTYILVCSVFV